MHADTVRFALWTDMPCSRSSYIFLMAEWSSMPLYYANVLPCGRPFSQSFLLSSLHTVENMSNYLTRCILSAKRWDDLQRLHVWMCVYVRVSVRCRWADLDGGTAKENRTYYFISTCLPFREKFRMEFILIMAQKFSADDVFTISPCTTNATSRPKPNGCERSFSWDVCERAFGTTLFGGDFIWK